MLSTLLALAASLPFPQSAPESTPDQSAATQPALQLPALFADHMVLQREQANPIWGEADPGSTVTIRIAEQEVTATTDDDGWWRTKLPKLPAGGPHTIEVRADVTRTIRDVLVGEVWLGSGQSNMAWPVKKARDFDTERAAATIPRIRMFTVKRHAATKPQRDCIGDWKACTPDNVGDFSATAYFFARSLHRELDVPIGIVHSSWGGSAIEAWTSLEAQREEPRLADKLASWDKRVAQWNDGTIQQRHTKRLEKWKEAALRNRKAGKSAPRKPRKPGNPTRDRNRPANLFHGQIAPLIGYGIRGAIWYQGERNARSVADAELYALQLPMMIRDWRARWGQGAFPFAWAQLPNFKKRQPDPGHVSAWAHLRESMRKSLAVENTGMAITIDLGEARDIHPQNKQDVGARLAQWALVDVYGRDGVASGPLLRSHAIEEGQIVVAFTNDKGLRTLDGGPPTGFAIAGQDKQWRWASALIQGKRVIVSHPEVTKPIAVRYAWGDNPDCNLINGAGLPASPFRTDDW